MAKIITLFREDDAEDPSTWDCQWKLYSFSNRHRSFKHPDHFFDNGQPKIGLRAKLTAGTAFVLSYFEHGNCVWSRQDMGPHDRWDSVRTAGVLLWEHSPREMGAKDYEGRAKAADSFLATYTAWCNGEVYGFTVEERVTLPCGHTELNLLDSCGGYFGNDLDYMASVIKAALAGDTEIEFKGDAKDLGDSLKLT